MRIFRKVIRITIEKYGVLRSYEERFIDWRNVISYALGFGILGLHILNWYIL